MSERSNKQNQQGHWEAHSYSSSSTKVNDNPPVVRGHEASASGAFDVS